MLCVSRGVQKKSPQLFLPLILCNLWGIWELLGRQVSGPDGFPQTKYKPSLFTMTLCQPAWPAPQMLPQLKSREKYEAILSNLIELRGDKGGLAILGSRSYEFSIFSGFLVGLLFTTQTSILPRVCCPNSCQSLASCLMTHLSLISKLCPENSSCQFSTPKILITVPSTVLIAFSINIPTSSFPDWAHNTPT